MRPLIAALLIVPGALLLSAELKDQTPLVAHEWGTFTSVAGPDGDPVRWTTLGGPADLPCFVAKGPLLKGVGKSLVRMETPVLYFYSPRAMKVSVKVNFPLGRITEWYPNATSNSAGNIQWDSVELKPGPDPRYPISQSDSRYFAARNTDSTPLSVNGESEKMIFYRGEGDFYVPLRPKFTGDGDIARSGSGVEIRNISKDRIPIAILFENRGGQLRYRIQSDLLETTVIGPLKRQASLVEIRRAIVEALVKRGGLYPKEAQAMMDTWQDSWFEEGMRLIYLLPQGQVDPVLPLTIQPAPAELRRAFVGRVELLSPAMKEELQTAVAKGDAEGLKRFGRFLTAFGEQIEGVAHAEAYKLAVNSVQANIGGCLP